MFHLYIRLNLHKSHQYEETDRYVGLADISGRYLFFVLPIYRHRPKRPMASEVLTKCCYIPYASRQLAQESTTNQVKTVILQQR